MKKLTARGGIMSLEEWAELPEDERGELVDGRLEAEEVPSFIHECVVNFLGALFRSWLAGHGFVFGSGGKFAVGPQRGRIPDLSVFLPGTKPPSPRGATDRRPDIVVEVISDSPGDRRRDRIDKLRDYAQFRVPFYWLLDPEARTLEILALDRDGHYRLELAEDTGRIIRVPGCEGLVLDLDELWAEVDRLISEAGERS